MRIFTAAIKDDGEFPSIEKVVRLQILLMELKKPAHRYFGYTEDEIPHVDRRGGVTYYNDDGFPQVEFRELGESTKDEVFSVVVGLAEKLGLKLELIDSEEAVVAGD